MAKNVALNVIQITIAVLFVIHSKTSIFSTATCQSFCSTKGGKYVNNVQCHYYLAHSSSSWLTAQSNCATDGTPYVGSSIIGSDLARFGSTSLEGIIQDLSLTGLQTVWVAIANNCPGSTLESDFYLVRGVVNSVVKTLTPAIRGNVSLQFQSIPSQSCVYYFNKTLFNYYCDQTVGSITGSICQAVCAGQSPPSTISDNSSCKFTTSTSSRKLTSSLLTTTTKKPVQTSNNKLTSTISTASTGNPIQTSSSKLTPSPSTTANCLTYGQYGMVSNNRCIKFYSTSNTMNWTTCMTQCNTNANGINLGVSGELAHLDSCSLYENITKFADIQNKSYWLSYKSTSLMTTNPNDFKAYNLQFQVIGTFPSQFHSVTTITPINEISCLFINSSGIFNDRCVDGYYYICEFYCDPSALGVNSTLLNNNSCYDGQTTLMTTTSTSKLTSAMTNIQPTSSQSAYLSEASFLSYSTKAALLSSISSSSAAITISSATSLPVTLSSPILSSTNDLLSLKKTAQTSVSKLNITIPEVETTSLNVLSFSSSSTSVPSSSPSPSSSLSSSTSLSSSWSSLSSPSLLPTSTILATKTVAITTKIEQTDKLMTTPTLTPNNPVTSHDSASTYFPADHSSHFITNYSTVFKNETNLSQTTAIATKIEQTDKLMTTSKIIFQTITLNNPIQSTLEVIVETKPVLNNSICTLSHWSEFTDCSKSCGTGSIKNRTRSVISAGNVCPRLTDVENCDVPLCNPMSNTLQKVAMAMQTLGCTWLIACCFGSFAFSILFWSCTTQRFLHASQQIALGVAHCLIALARSETSHKLICTLASIVIQFGFIVNFSCLMLEATHIYSLLTTVVSSDSLFNKRINFSIGWLIPFVMVSLTILTSYDHYLSVFSCWLNLGHEISWATFVPVLFCTGMGMILLEAGQQFAMPDLYITDRNLLQTTKICQKGLLFTLPLNVAAWYVGSYAVYAQNFAMFASVCGLNMSLGCSIAFFHTLANEKAQQFVIKCWKKVRNG